MDDDFAAEVAAELFALLNNTQDSDAAALMRQTIVDMAWPAEQA